MTVKEMNEDTKKFVEFLRVAEGIGPYTFVIQIGEYKIFKQKMRAYSNCNGGFIGPVKTVYDICIAEDDEVIDCRATLKEAKAFCVDRL